MYRLACIKTSQICKLIAYPAMYDFSKDAPINVEEFRARLRKMTDAQLLGYGKAARFMCSPIAYFGKAPRETLLSNCGSAALSGSAERPPLAFFYFRPCPSVIKRGTT